MSVRTVVEFNHDQTHAISRDPTEFHLLLINALRSGFDQDWQKLQRFGIRAVGSAHHSSERLVTINGQTVKL